WMFGFMSKMHKTLFSKVVQSSNYSAFVLQAGGKEFAIYTLPTTGLQVESMLNKEVQRPQTHTFLDTILTGFDIDIKKVILTDVEDGVYFSKILLSKKGEEKEDIISVDARPSDSLLLALKHDTEVLCSEEVLNKSPSYQD
ncbi:bifunctional nuclease family protein, partial [bacterium]|nr:bifunctional nuclease family protein [bacterium]